MRNPMIAKASTTIEAPRAAVWHALIDPDAIECYMAGAKVTTSWAEDTPIYWTCQSEGVRYENKGIVLAYDPPRCLEFSHYSPRSGLPDLPRSYHTVKIELDEVGRRTRVTLKEEDNPSKEACAHAQKSWELMLKGLKQFVEQQTAVAEH